MDKKSIFQHEAESNEKFEDLNIKKKLTFRMSK